MTDPAVAALVRAGAYVALLNARAAYVYGLIDVDELERRVEAALRAGA